MDASLLPPTTSATSASVAPALKHSWLGISSFILSLVGGFAMLILFGVAGYLQMSTPGGMDEKSGTAIFVGLLLFAVMAVHLVGTGLAIGGLVQKDRKKIFAVLGLVFNGLVILVTLALIVIGNKMG